MEKMIFKGILQFEDKSTYGQKLKVSSENNIVTSTKSAVKTKNYLHRQLESSEFQNTQPL